MDLYEGELGLICIWLSQLGRVISFGRMIKVMICFLVHQGTKKIKRERVVRFNGRRNMEMQKKIKKIIISGDKLRDKYNLVAPIICLHSLLHNEP